MSWATTRQLLFALGVVLLIVAILGALYAFFIYSPASCNDGVQNGTEIGIDCGGSCALLCEAPPIVVSWARSVPVARGVYHAVAEIKNSDTNARGEFPYTVSVFDAKNILIAERKGMFVIESGEVTPLFEANIITGERIPSRTFVDVGEGTFYRSERVASPLKILSFELDGSGDRLRAQVQNQTVFPVDETEVTALLYNETGVLIGASQTVVEGFGARERKEVVFTWQEPFDPIPARLDVVARVRAQ